MDTFKIITFVKRGSSSTSYSYVPHKWEKNGIAYWPKTNVTCLRQDATSKPGQDWLQYKCRVKKLDIQGLEEAELWEEEFVNASCTDVEDSLRINHKQLEKNNDNELLEENNNKTGTIDTLFAKINSQQPDPEPVIILNNEPAPKENMTMNPLVDVTSDFELLRSDIKTIITNQKRLSEQVTSGFLHMQATNDSFYKMLRELRNRNETSNLEEPNKTNFGEMFQFPLNTEEDIMNFNREIEKNTEFKNHLMKTYSTIGGTEGKEEGKIVAKKLLGILFTKYILTKYSWTGISRTPSLPKKKAFQVMGGIISLFNDLLIAADSHWSITKTEKFFKWHTLKHARQMNDAFQRKQKKNADKSNDDTQDDDETQEDNDAKEIENEIIN